jgi:cell division protein FtsL
LSRLVRVVWLVLLLALVACAGSMAAAQHSGKKRKRIVHRSNAAEVVVPRGQSLQIAFRRVETRRMPGPWRLPLPAA